MALKVNIIKMRLREAFGSDSQETVGKKLNMTQGNVSKLLSGSQQPTLDTIYQAAEVYGVSVDWLLGLTDNKIIERSKGATTYMSATKVLSDMILHHAIELTDENGRMVLSVVDPLIKNLVHKSITLRNTDRELNANWEENRLTLFADCPLVINDVWNDDGVSFLADEAVTESNWKEVYIMARKKDEEYTEMFGADTSPFGDE